MFNSLRRNAIKDDMAEFSSWLIGQSLRCAADISSQIPETPQLLAATEALAFFVHALRREAFRPNQFKVWSNLAEPSLQEMVPLFAMTLSGWSGSELDREAMVKDVQNLISTRNLEYQTLPFLSGKSDDRQAVTTAAVRRIADAVDPARRAAVAKAMHALYAEVVGRELPEQVARLEKLLYGDRAAA
jgi:hypothetical protein